MSQESKIPFFRNLTPATNLMTVFSLIFIGYAFSTFFIYLVTLFFFKINLAENETAFSDITNESTLMFFRFKMMVDIIFVFITSATIFRKLMEYKGQDYLVVRKKPSLKIIGIISLLFLICFPVSNFLMFANGLIDTNDALLEAEAQNAVFTKALLFTDNFSTYLLNLVCIGLLTAIGEELLFRSVFQRLLIKLIPNLHVAVLLGAGLFSLMHFSFYGFIPRFFMGIILGYIYLSTANIWYCIVFHFLNNAIAITFAYLMHKGFDLSFYDMLGAGKIDRWFGLIILASIIVFGIFQLNRLIKQEFVDELREF
jgi:membrane protease YdiL (CAAX protease family)